MAHVRGGASAADCHVPAFAASTVLLQDFQALFERVLHESPQGNPVTVPIAAAELLACRCEENAAREIAIFARNPDTGELVVSVPLTGAFQAQQLPSGGLLVSAPPARREYVVTFKSESTCTQVLGCLRSFTAAMRAKEAQWRAANPEAAAAADAAAICAAAGVDPAVIGRGGGTNGGGNGVGSGRNRLPSASVRDPGIITTSDGVAVEPTLNQFGQLSQPVPRRWRASAERAAAAEPNRVGLVISRPTDARRTTHVEFNAASQTFAGVPTELASQFAALAFNLPLSQVTCEAVPGYACGIPLVLVLLREFLLKRDGHVSRTARIQPCTNTVHACRHLHVGSENSVAIVRTRACA
jgi:hypothetical protein